MASGTGVADADNVLSNGDLDNIAVVDQANSSPVGWTTFASRTINDPSGGFNDAQDSEPWCNVQQAGGYGVFFKPFQGSTNANPSLNDYLTVNFYQDNSATPGTKFTLSGYAAGEANFCAFDSSGFAKALFVVEFLDASSTVIASNALNLVTAGLPSGGPGSMTLLTTPQFTAPANTATVRAGVWLLNAWSTTGQQSFFVDAFDLESVAPPGSPVITNQPVSVTVSPGGTTGFTVGVSNLTGVTYQWQFYNTTISNIGHWSGTTTKTLTVTGASASDVGHYRCFVANGFGSVYSQSAALALLGLSVNPIAAINGKIGDTYVLQYSTSLAPTTWIPLSTNKLTTSPQYILDLTTSGCSGNRFYRAVYQP
jgi:hypothetical protein